ncbi:hypothetical protein CDD83_5958 [Cordyceps sp. RAO-2017]|nr:hypothetical protein CDD83_5958 [Cordyceps sp. RAO-2017]
MGAASTARTSTHASCLSTVDGCDGGRYNNSRRAHFQFEDVKNPFAEGTFRWVAKARYDEGLRTGQPCAIKWFKSGAVFEHAFFSLDIKAVHKAREIIHEFNSSRIVNKPIKINMTATWRFDENSGEYAGQSVLCEPFIENYQKFNSNSGWSDDSIPWGKVMQALSHFSFHSTGGKYVLCDLQGGIYKREVVLADPVILSRNREFGVTDLGPEGISAFFCGHTCNLYCRPDWHKPEKPSPSKSFPPVQGTTMSALSVPTAHSRPDGSSLMPA